MKKTLSIVLALIMALSMAVPAFAADYTIKLGEEKAITVKSDEPLDLQFKPLKKGAYTVTVTITKGEYSSFEVYADDEDYIGGGYVENGLEELETCGSDIIVNSGSDVHIYFYHGSETTAKLNVKINDFSGKKLKLGKNTVSDDYCTTFLFTASETGYYNFKSDADTDFSDPYIDIYGMYGYVAANDDNGRVNDGFSDFNFDVSVYLEKGEMYFVNAYNYACYEDVDPKAYTMTATYNLKEKVEELAIIGSWEETDIIKLAKDVEDYAFVCIVPTGALPTADIVITSSNDDIVAIDDYNRDTGEIDFHTVSSGKATITVEANGMTAQIDVKVFSDFETFLLNLLDRLINFFSFLFSLISGDMMF